MIGAGSNHGIGNSSLLKAANGDIEKDGGSSQEWRI